MSDQDPVSFRLSKYFAEHVPRALDSLHEEPEGIYQIVYRVGEFMVSAHIWRERPQLDVKPEYTEADREFLKCCNVSAEEESSESAR